MVMTSSRVFRHGIFLLWSSLAWYGVAFQSPLFFLVNDRRNTPVDRVRGHTHSRTSVLAAGMGNHHGGDLLTQLMYEMSHVWTNTPTDGGIVDLMVVGGGTMAVGAVAAAPIIGTLQRPPNQLLTPSQIQEILQGTYLLQQKSRGRESSPLESFQCIYKASRDGWSATAFHDNVDRRGSALVVVRTFQGAVFGGFNPTGWSSTDDYSSSSNAFLWCLVRGGIQKYPAQPGAPSLFDYATAGPVFGTGDLVVGPAQSAVMGGFTGPQMENDSLLAGDLRLATILPGQAYVTDKFWPVRGYKVRLQEVEVYC